MPPKKRNPDSDVNPAVKRKKKKNDDSDDEFDDDAGEDAENNGSTEVVGEYPDVTLEGSMLSGELLLCGGTNWDLIGRKQLPKNAKNGGGPNLWGPHRMDNMIGTRVRTVVSGSTACHSVIITAEGKALTFGRNDMGQLGQGDCLRKDVPTPIPCLDGVNVVDAACGKNHTLFLTDKGVVYACGDNKMGQLGLGHQSGNITSPTRISYKGPPIRKMSCGAEFSMICDIRGNLYSFGCPEFGQLGHNTDGKYFVTSTKLSFKCETVPRKVNVFIEKTREGHIVPVTDVEVRDMGCGTNHTVIRDSKKRVFSWGFGGYGRLGHAEPKDEMVPRLLKFFDGPNRGCVQVYSGSTFSFGLNELGVLYLWGQTKPTGEAAMYPKLVQDLSGWRIRSIGCCNKSVVVAADDSLVSWGPSPTYGELGYGDNKPRSSTTPQEVKTLDNVYIHSVSCGYGHTLMIARQDEDSEKERIAKLPVFKP
ncbi:protein RCC2 homolog [Ylistrum balloti]|uniref:protein RCC2 homolog n=1 Tax=Ylistrum balloti TaxID=509963 RepID=UPI0029058FBD|nr:protein RCC2 homolog [Ylistrum balloti]